MGEKGPRAKALWMRLDRKRKEKKIEEMVDEFPIIRFIYPSKPITYRNTGLGLMRYCIVEWYYNRRKR